MPQLFNARTVTVSIACPPEQVYAFASNPANFPTWVTSFVTGARQTAGGWLLDTTEGTLGIEFAPENPFGVLDHRVTVRPGLDVLNPMRVMPNGDGSEVTFTLFQRPDVSDEMFSSDGRMVEQDLLTLKRVLE